MGFGVSGLGLVSCLVAITNQTALGARFAITNQIGNLLPVFRDEAFHIEVVDDADPRRRHRVVQRLSSDTSYSLTMSPIKLLSQLKQPLFKFLLTPIQGGNR